MALLLFAAIAAVAGCSSKPDQKVWEITGPVFGTEYHIKVVLPEDRDRLEALSEGISDTLDRVDSTMSTYRDDSELSRFNRHKDGAGIAKAGNNRDKAAATNNNGWFPVSAPLYKVIKESQRISRLSDGAFDITIGPVVNLWGFGPEARPQNKPAPEKLSRRLAEVGYDKLQLRESPAAIRSSKPLYLDLSAIAKGYGVDAVADYLQSQGIDNLLVEIGGEVSARGVKPSGEAWRLAIEKPTSRQQSVQQVVTLKNRTMATSGDYRNYYEVDGKSYSHTINPATGTPITNKLASVTVIAGSTMTADALATTLDVMGEKRGYTFAVKHNMAAYFIYRDGDSFEWRYTPAFSSYLTN